MVGKLGTQLVRWGGTDAVYTEGHRKKFIMQTWRRGEWIPVQDVATTLQVPVEILRKLLSLSKGKRGWRLEFQNENVRAIWEEESLLEER